MLLFYFIFAPSRLPAKGVGLSLVIVSILLGPSLPARGAWEPGSGRTGTSTEAEAAPKRQAAPQKSSLDALWLLTSGLGFSFGGGALACGRLPFDSLCPPGRPRRATAPLQQKPCRGCQPGLFPLLFAPGFNADVCPSFTPFSLSVARPPDIFGNWGHFSVPAKGKGGKSRCCFKVGGTFAASLSNLERWARAVFHNLPKS